MIKNVIWSPLAEMDLENILNYLNKEWGEKTTKSFIKKTFHLIDLITLNPKQFPVINIDLSIRKCVISKHNSLYYRQIEQRIDILRIYDSRQNPANLKF